MMQGCSTIDCNSSSSSSSNNRDLFGTRSLVLRSHSLCVHTMTARGTQIHNRQVISRDLTRDFPDFSFLTFCLMRGRENRNAALFLSFSFARRLGKQRACISIALSLAQHRPCVPAAVSAVTCYTLASCAVLSSTDFLVDSVCGERCS